MSRGDVLRMHVPVSADLDSWSRKQGDSERLDRVKRRLRVGAATAGGLAAVVFILGASVYVFDRAASPFSGLFLVSGESTFGFAGGSLPSFAHTFAFTVWIALAFGGRAHTVVRVAVFWAVLESAFELAQVPALSVLPRAGLDIIGVPWGLLASFSGTFDPWDLVAIWVAGALATWCVLLGVSSPSSRIVVIRVMAVRE